MRRKAFTCAAKERIRIVPEGLRGEDIVAGLCPSEAVAKGLSYASSKRLLEAGNRRFPGTTARAAMNGEATNLRVGPTTGSRLRPTRAYDPPPDMRRIDASITCFRAGHLALEGLSVAEAWV
ncbi:hypothetical protein AAFN86_26515 [Roseomonas sp. CAU 1739]|uniref:hypothetical protein n=1 Tax=Roseomonas sp. CAU 1739 TaxID=3140364 RepID=UPI00325AE689